MRTSLVVVLAMILGTVVGLSSTWARFGTGRKVSLLPSAGGIDDPETLPAGRRPKIMVDHETHDFRAVERGATVTHPFKFTNVGNHPLKLENGGTSCMKCTVTNLTTKVLPPGHSTVVVVEYNATGNHRHFRQGATILTNDPERPRVLLEVTGEIVSTYQLVPDSGQLVVSRISPTETKQVELRVLAYTIDNLEVTRHEFTDPETATLFSAEMATIPTEELDDKAAKSGVRVTITIKPGLPLGQFQQTIRLETNLPKHSTIEVPIGGKVVSDITIYGQGWNEQRNALVLGVVPSKEGAKRMLRVHAIGPHRDEVQLRVAKVEPSWLKVEVGQPEAIAGKEIVLIPLTIEIPKGTPPANHLGSQQGKAAEILFETTHPQAKQIKALVQFAIEH